MNMFLGIRYWTQVKHQETAIKTISKQPAPNLSIEKIHHEEMYKLNLTGPIGLVIGNEGKGVSRLVKDNCDLIAAIPMKGDIDSLNASVATGVLAYEIVRQRLKA